MNKVYTVTTATGTSTFSRKDRAVKHGDSLGVSYTVTSPAGKVVHEWVEYTAPEATDAAPVKVCKKDASHGAHRVTKSGSYCFACDRIVAERQKAERAAARATKMAAKEATAA